MREHQKRSVRVALFVSHYFGFFILKRLLDISKYEPKIMLCGVATDDPYERWANAQKRIWKYGYTSDEANMVGDLATAFHLITSSFSDGEFGRGRVLGIWR